MELSIVILCYRSEEALIPFVKEVKYLTENLTKSYEIILVGNYIEGSTDRTKEIVHHLASQDNCYKVVTKPKQGMMGWDMIEGLKIAVGKYICVIDGDGQFPIESIQRCFDEIKTGNYDLVKTYRTKRYDGIYRVCISKIYNFIFSILFPDLGSKDVNSKPKMISREAYKKMNLKSTDWFIDAEIMITVRRYKMKFKEFPTTFYKISNRASFVKFAAIIEFIKNLTVYRIKEFSISKDDR